MFFKYLLSPRLFKEYSVGTDYEPLYLEKLGDSIISLVRKKLVGFCCGKVAKKINPKFHFLIFV